MSDTATAAGSAMPEPTAIEPSRVLVLNDDEQQLLLTMIDDLARSEESPSVTPQWGAVERLRNRIAYGDEYVNAKDELARTTLRKRRLEGEVRRCNVAIARCEEQVVEQLLEEGESSCKHAATGASLILDRKVWAKLDVDVTDLPKSEAELARATAKAAAAEGLKAAGLGEYVRPDFNLNSISAYFREQIKTYDAEQRELPEHKRVPRTVESFLPDELRGLIDLTDAPTISVRAS